MCWWCGRYTRASPTICCVEYTITLIMCMPSTPLCIPMLPTPTVNTCTWGERGRALLCGRFSYSARSCVCIQVHGRMHSSICSKYTTTTSTLLAASSGPAVFTSPFFSLDSLTTILSSSCTNLRSPFHLLRAASLTGAYLCVVCEVCCVRGLCIHAQLPQSWANIPLYLCNNTLVVYSRTVIVTHECVLPCNCELLLDGLRDRHGVV